MHWRHKRERDDRRHDKHSEALRDAIEQAWIVTIVVVGASIGFGVSQFFIWLIRSAR